MNAELNLNENIIENNVNNIKNLYLKHLAVLIDSKQLISDCCLEEYDLKIAPFQEKKDKERSKRIRELKKMGLKTENNNMTLYLNYLSPACLYCKMGIGPTITLTYDCTRNCFYCFGYKPQNIKRDIYKTLEIDVNREIQYLKNYNFEKNIINLGISRGEPLLVLDKVLEAIKTVKRLEKIKSITRIYTNGDLLNEGILKKLKEAGLDEIRFGIKPGEFGILNKIIIAKKYIPRVMMEGPVFPDSEEFMKKLLLELNRIKIFGVNLLDLRCRYNIHIYKKKNYMFAYKEKRPFYEEWYQGWPIYGSEEVIFNLLEFAIKKDFSISIHYCPVKQNANVSLLNVRKRKAHIMKQPYETITKEGLLRKIIVCSPEHFLALEDLKKYGVSKQEINISSNNARLETNVRNLRYLNRDKYEIGILDTLSEGEEVGIKVIKSKYSPNSLTGNINVAVRNSLYLASIGTSIAGVYFQKKSEKNDNAVRVIELLKKKLKILPDSGAIYLALSQIYFFLKKYREAIKTANKVIRSGYSEGLIYLLLSSCYKEIKDYGKAIEMLRKAEKINPKDINTNLPLLNLI